MSTNDDKKYARIKSLRNHGSEIKYYHDFVGGNFRIDAIQAAVISCKLPYLDQWHAKRAANAAYYNEQLSIPSLKGKLILPTTMPGTTRHVFNQYTLRILNGKRDEFVKKLRENGVGCDIYYPKSMEVQDCFKYLGHTEKDFPVTQQLCKEVVSIPIFPELTRTQQDYVIETIKGILS